MKDLIIVKLPLESSLDISLLKDYERSLKNRTLEKYRETEVIFLTSSYRIYMESRNAVKIELLFGKEGENFEYELSSLSSYISILKKYDLDNINNIAIFEDAYLIIKDLQDFYLDLSNNIMIDYSHIIYGGKIPILILLCLLKSDNKYSTINSLRQICDKLNINLQEVKTNFEYAE